MATTSKLAVIGAGKMGTTLIRALLDSKTLSADQVVATTRHSETAKEVAGRLNIDTTQDNLAAAQSANMILISVKPQILAEVLTQIAPALHERQLLVSTVASATTQFIEKHVPAEVAVVRTMPNTPCLIRAGMTALCGGSHATTDHLHQAETIFRAVGRTLVLDEKYFDAVTALSASGPAYIYVVLESLAEGGVKVGLPRNIATELAAQMCLGAAQMVLQTREHPALLKDAVTTPAGCTIDGLLKLEEGGLRVTLIKAVVEATQRAGQLIHS